jgi:putative transposase
MVILVRPRPGVREIQGHLAEFYGVDASPDLISAVADAILEGIAAWQDRPLEAVYLAFGARADGRKEILGPWIEQTEGAYFWLRVMTGLRVRSTASNGRRGPPDPLGRRPEGLP